MIFALMLQLSATPSTDAWGSFSRSHALIYVTDSVSIIQADRDDETQQVTFKMVDSRTSPTESRTFETDSDACPAMRDVIDSMAQLEMPHPKPPGHGWDLSVADGAVYTLKAPSSFPNGSLEITSNVGSPLADWVDRALDALEPCWKPVGK